MKLRSDSFAARLSDEQKDELFVDLAGGKSLRDAARQVHEWTKAEWGGRPPSTQAISAWQASELVRRRMLAARESALVAQATAPADLDEQARKAIGQAKFMTVLQGIKPADIAMFERNDLARTKLELDKKKLEQDGRVQKRDLALAQAKLLLERARGGERSEDLQQQIDLALDEIERMKRGEDAS